MKKSILALSAAVAVSGLGFAGAANALAVFSNDGANAVEVELASSGVGHYLFTPYYTAQADNNTLLSVINTDSVNGKAVKVRFRGAANSDDVLDFTLFLSPGDVWTASLKQGKDGHAQITTPDNSCTLPAAVKDVPFRTGRLDQSLDADSLATHTREGYVEFLNMADIPPRLGRTGATNPLFTNIKHVKGVAPCASAAFAEVLNTSVYTPAQARAAGLDNPTGGLTGGWTILRLSNISTYSGLHTAAVAYAGANPLNGQGVSAAGNFAFAPQSEEPVSAISLPTVTADPLLVGYSVGGANYVEPLWMDLPDMSTPLTTSYFGNAAGQADRLSGALSKTSVINEFVSTADSAVVPGATDWVVSQPTRRYQMAYDYLAEARVFNAAGTVNLTGSSYYSVVNTTVGKKDKLGSFICLRGRLAGSDREEGGVDSSVDFSPAPAAAAYCGEVFTMSFNSVGSKVLNATLTNVPVQMKIGGKAPEAGWASFTPSSLSVGQGLPMTGFAAISLRDDINTGNYGYTYGHRW